MRSKMLALMMLTAIIVAVLATAVGHAQNLNSSTARLCNGLPYLCEKGFDEVTFPGNHNSGSGADGRLHCCGYGPSPAVDQCEARNQGKTITEQLEFGIRYFDIDTCICEGSLVTCHRCKYCTNCMHQEGPTIEQMLNEFDAFLNLKENRNEVIVLTFGDQFDNPGGYDLQELLYDQLSRWANVPQGELTIFKQDPPGSWPTLGDLVDTNQRIVVFVRNPGRPDNPELSNPALVPLFQKIGVLSEKGEKGHIFDTWIERGCTYGCDGVVSATYNKCVEAREDHSDKLVLVTVNCSYGLCLFDLARLCQGHLLQCLDECRCGLLGLPSECTDPLSGRIPNFIIADWTQNDLHKANIVQVVKYFNQGILKEDNALDISKDTASHIGFQSNRNGKMISARSEGEGQGLWFNTQSFTDQELWKYEKYVHNNPEDLEHLEYGSKICLQSKSSGKYLRSIGSGGLTQQDWCRGDEAWIIERYDPNNDHPSGSVGRVQAGDSICLYSVADKAYVRAYDEVLGLQGHCRSDEKFYVHAGWNDSDEDRVIDGGDNCPNTYNPEQKDTDADGVGDACDPVATGDGGGGGCLIGTLPHNL